jgi:hypothetical protein
MSNSKAGEASIIARRRGNVNALRGRSSPSPHQNAQAAVFIGVLLSCRTALY